MVDDSSFWLMFAVPYYFLRHLPNQNSLTVSTELTRLLWQQRSEDSCGMPPIEVFASVMLQTSGRMRVEWDEYECVCVFRMSAQVMWVGMVLRCCPPVIVRNIPKSQINVFPPKSEHDDIIFILTATRAQNCKPPTSLWKFHRMMHDVRLLQQRLAHCGKCDVACMTAALSHFSRKGF